MDEQRLEEIARKAGESVREPYRAAVIGRVRTAIREALSSQEEELVFMREAVEAAVKDRDYYEQQEKAAEAEVRSLREERDAAMEVLSGGRLYVPNASGELVEQPTTLLERAQHVAMAAETEADIVDEIRSARDAAEAEVKRLREREGKAFPDTAAGSSLGNASCLPQ